MPLNSLPSVLEVEDGEQESQGAATAGLELGLGIAPKKAAATSTFNVPLLLGALWSLFEGIWGLKGWLRGAGMGMLGSRAQVESGELLVWISTSFVLFLWVGIMGS